MSVILKTKSCPVPQYRDTYGKNSLSHIAFRCGHEWSHLHGTVFWSHLHQYLLEGMESTTLCIYIVLVDLQFHSIINYLFTAINNSSLVGLFSRKELASCSNLHYGGSSRKRKRKLFRRLAGRSKFVEHALSNSWTHFVRSRFPPCDLWHRSHRLVPAGGRPRSATHHVIAMMPTSR